MGYHQQAKCPQHGCWEILKRKQGSFLRMMGGGNDHFFGTTFVQELLMDLKKYLFFI